MGFTEEINHLGNNILGSYDTRIKFLGQNIIDVKNLKNDANKLIHRFKKEHKSMGNKLRAELGSFVDDLTESVESLRYKFGRKQKSIHNEYKSAHQSWQKASKIMASKRKNFKSSLSRAKQTASR